MAAKSSITPQERTGTLGCDLLAVQVQQKVVCTLSSSMSPHGLWFCGMVQAREVEGRSLLAYSISWSCNGPQVHISVGRTRRAR